MPSKASDDRSQENKLSFSQVALAKSLVVRQRPCLPHQSSSGDAPRSSLWQEAFESLGPDDRGRIPGTVQIKDGLAEPDHLLQLLESKVRDSEAKQWKFKKKNGQTVSIRHLFQKAVKWVQRFRAIGDTVVSFDPGHAALPWALVRLLLEVCLSLLLVPSKE